MADNMADTDEDLYYFNSHPVSDPLMTKMWEKSFEDYNRLGKGKIIWQTYKDTYPSDMDVI